MARAVAAGASLTCSFGTTPATLSVLPAGRVTADGAPMACVMDHQPNVNIAPFGMCTTLSNPQVAAATSAAQGVLTPQPCVPVTVAPFSPGAAQTQVAGKPALTDISTCTCTWGGLVTITNPSTTAVQVS